MIQTCRLVSGIGDRIYRRKCDAGKRQMPEKSTCIVNVIVMPGLRAGQVFADVLIVLQEGLRGEKIVCPRGKYGEFKIIPNYQRVSSATTR